MADNKENKTCPTCGRDDFASELGMKQHHTKTHGESLSNISISCKYCDEKYKVHKSNKDSSFCSMECMSKYYSEEQVGEDHPLYEKITITCEQCKEEYKIQPHEKNENGNNFCSIECYRIWQDKNIDTDWHSKNNPQYKEKININCKQCNEEYKVIPSREESKFCSEECIYNWMSEYQTGENHPNWTKVRLQCEMCNNFYNVTKSRKEESKFCSQTCYDEFLSNKNVELECEECNNIIKIPQSKKERGKRFCSKECMSKWQSKNITGKDHPNWKEDSIEYPYIRFEPVRKEILERDDFECQRCGISEQEHKNKIGQGLEVHHIYKLRMFFEDIDDTILNKLSSNNLEELSTSVVEMIYHRSEVAHNRSNLVTVCSDCHLGENGLERLPVEEQVELVGMSVPDVSPEDIINSSE